MKPKIRFKDYQEDWGEKHLGELCTQKPKYGTNTKAIPYQENLPRFVRITDIDEDGCLIKEKAKSLPSKPSRRFILKKGDFLFARMGDMVGKTYLHENEEKECTFASYLIRFQANPSCLSVDFLKSFTQTGHYKAWLKKMLKQSAQPNINAKDFSELPLTLPSLAEQERIAKISQTVDKRIRSLRQCLKKLELYTCLTASKLFSGIIRLEAPEEKEFAPWQKLTLGDVWIESKLRTKWENQEPLLSSTCTGIFTFEDYFKKGVGSRGERNTGYKVVHQNQLVFSPQNLWMGNINVNFEFPRGMVSPTYKVFRFAEGLASPHFFSFLIKDPLLKKYFDSCSKQGASVVRRNLDLKSLLLSPVLLPSLEEQEKIAEFLTNLTNYRENLERMLRLSEEYREKLLNCLFPS